MEQDFFSNFYEGERMVPSVDFELVYKNVKCPRGVILQLPEGSQFLFEAGSIIWSVEGLVGDPHGATVRIEGRFAEGVKESVEDFLTWIEVFEQHMNDAAIHIGKEDYFVADNRSIQIL